MTDPTIPHGPGAANNRAGDHSMTPTPEAKATDGLVEALREAMRAEFESGSLEWMAKGVGTGGMPMNADHEFISWSDWLVGRLVKQPALWRQSPYPEHYAAALDVVCDARKGSTSLVQRKVGIGYNAACRCIERMEAEGVIGRPGVAGIRPFLNDPRPAAPQGQSDHTGGNDE